MRAARVIVGLVRHLVPRPFRARWEEEWLGEIDRARPSWRVLRRACGALPDALACRAVHRERAAREPIRPALTGAMADLRYALRQLRQSPGFAFAAIASLSVGMTALTVTFSGLNAILFRSLPGVGDEDRLVRVGLVRRVGPFVNAVPIGANELDYLRATLTTLSEVATWRPVRVALNQGAEPQAVRAELVSENYFAVLRSPVGAVLRAGAAEPAAVVSHGCALRHFGTPEAALGSTIDVNGVSTRIVAVAPPGFTGSNPGDFGESERDRTQLWLPFEAAPGGASESTSAAEIIGRLQPSATVAGARAQAAAVAPREDGARPRISPIALGPNDSAQEIAAAITLMFSVPVIVLAIGCANAANLLLARAIKRRAELAVRLSIGATRARIVRQLLAESVLIAGVSGVVGLAGTAGVLTAMAAFLPIPVPIDGRVALFALAATVVTGILFGMTPALTATRDDVMMSLRDADSGGGPRPHLRRGLVVAQIALSILLLVMAGLFIRTLQHLSSVDDGRDLANVAALVLDSRIGRYSADGGTALQHALLERANQIPGVVSAAIASSAPFVDSPGVRYRPADDPSAAERYSHGGDYLGRFVETAGLTIVAGRNFEDADRRSPPSAALVSESLARRTWPGADPLGRRLLVRVDNGSPTDVTVIGVTRNVRAGVDTRDSGAILLPSPLAYHPTFSLWVRTAGDPALVVPHLRQIVRDLDPGLPIVDIGPAEWWRYRHLGPMRWVAAALGGLGTIALVLAAGGLYAVMAYHVAARRHELGVRAALGARPRDLVALVGGEAMRLAAWGLAAGLLLSTAAAQIVRSELFGVSPLDPIAFGGVAVLMTIVALAASASPARRAGVVDPMAVLRRT